MNIFKINKDMKITLQFIVACILVIAGITLLFIGFYAPPIGEIANSVLVAYGEVSTFAGSLIGVDYHYRYKVHEDKKKYSEDGDGQ